MTIYENKVVTAFIIFVHVFFSVEKNRFEVFLSRQKTPAGSVRPGRGVSLGFNGAGDGIRTRDLQLGKLTLYH